MIVTVEEYEVGLHQQGESAYHVAERVVGPQETELRQRRNRTAEFHSVWVGNRDAQALALAPSGAQTVLARSAEGRCEALLNPVDHCALACAISTQERHR